LTTLTDAEVVAAFIDSFNERGVDGASEWVTSGVEMVRYADDFVLLCHSEAAAQRALALVQQWTAEAGLTLHPEKTHIVDAA